VAEIFEEGKGRDKTLDKTFAGPDHYGDVELAQQIAAEREEIIKLDINPWQKQRLLESNRRAIVNALGGSTFNTESVVYVLILLSCVTVIILAALTAFWDLPKEVTLTFVGTTVGGLVATIAQKIGRL
jgi:uncharacterized membrane protein